jgi:hypothetical protein
MGASPVARIENPSRQIRLNALPILFFSNPENSCRQPKADARFTALIARLVPHSSEHVFRLIEREAGRMPNQTTS